jgi:hypothetical protein
MTSCAQAKTGITFTVDEVVPANQPLKECPAHVAAKEMLSEPINSCSDYHSTVVAEVRFQPLLAAVYMAYSEHRPLVLTPDAIWITIAQGVAHHMVANAERLRDRLVSHQGKETLKFFCDGWVLESPENPWPEAFQSWSSQIRQYVGPQTHDLLRCDFSTTGPVEHAVSDIVMMDIFQQYFHYEAYCICGIPQITLEGTQADWQRICDKTRGLRVFDMDWWLDHLQTILEQFARASRGDVDRDHWQDICKLRKEYGGNIINGWIAKLFPYLLEYIKGPCTRRNPIFDTGEGFKTLFAPSGLSRVPFTFIKGKTGEKHLMHAIGGLLGISQDKESLALRPKVGWAICKAGSLDALIERVSQEHTSCPVEALLHDDKNRTASPHDYLPADLGRLCCESPGGVCLFGNATHALYRILPRHQMRALDWGEEPEVGNSRGPDGRTWHRFVDLADGSFLAIDLDINRFRFSKMHSGDWEGRKLFSPICHCRPETIGRAGTNPVIALSFSELLQRMLDSGGTLFWQEPGFKAHGDADEFVRREPAKRQKKPI